MRTRRKDKPTISGTRFIPVSVCVVLRLADVIYPLNDFGRLDLLLRGELRLALIIGEAREGRGQSGGRGGQGSGGRREAEAATCGRR